MYQEHKLANGLKLITVPMAGTETTTLLVMFATGSRFESREQNGLSHFLEHMFFKGTTKRPDTMSISSALDNVGAEFNAFSSKEYTGYWIKTAGEHTELALDVLSDMLINSKFDENEINREKGVITEEINMYQDNPMWYIEEIFEALIYGDTPAGWDTAGTKENVAGFTREQFITYWQQQYGSDSATLILAGKLPENPEALIGRYFDGLNKSTYKKQLPTVDTFNGPKLKIHFKDTDQAHLSLGVRSVPYASADESTIKVLSVILGGSMSSRLFTQLRERNGLAYYVRCNQESYTDTGYMTTQAGVPTDKIEQAIKIILAEYSKLTTELVPDEELTRVKNLLKGKTPLSLESSDEVAEFYARQAVLLFEQENPRRGIIKPDELLKGIDGVRAEDIQALAKKLFRPENLNLAVIGPYKDSAPFEALLKL